MLFNLHQIAVVAAVAGNLVTAPAVAQNPAGIPDTIPINPNLFAPPPPPIPPPRIEVPKVPQMDAVPTTPKLSQPRRKPFDQRVSECIEEAAAAGLGPNERAAYSRLCVNR